MCTCHQGAEVLVEIKSESVYDIVSLLNSMSHIACV